MKIHLAALSAFALFFALSANATNLPGYYELPTARQREKSNSGYAPYPKFNQIRVVHQNTGAPIPEWASVITDPKYRTEIQAGMFKTLTLEHLDILEPGIYTTAGVLHFPFVISVEHMQGDYSPANFNQGTIEVAGEILVQYEGSNLSVTVNHFYDSQWLERKGREMGYNTEIDINFAKAIVVPILESYFNAKPARIKTLLSLARHSPSVTLP